jgi:hypothetical protein
MARSWLKVSEFDKLRDNRRRSNSPLKADNAAHTTPIPGSIFYAISLQEARRLGVGDVAGDAPRLVVGVQVRHRATASSS